MYSYIVLEMMFKVRLLVSLESMYSVSTGNFKNSVINIICQ